MARFAGGRAGSGITGIAGVSWTHQTAQMPPNRPQLTMSEIKLLGGRRYAAWRLKQRGFRELSRFGRSCRGLGEIVLHFARGPGPRLWRPASITGLAAGQTYHIQGWTILQTSDSATFTSDATGHGMTVTVDKNKGGDGQAQADVLRF
jgi:hypothetical protein